MESIKSKLKYILPVGVILISLCVFMPRTQGIFFPQDEFGYWNNAAKICGIDWNSVAKGQDSYAYGYSLLLIPLMKLHEDAVLMYKTALLMNGVLAAIHCILILRFVEAIFDDGQKHDDHGCLVGGIGAVCCAYPASLLYMNYTTAEVLLNVLFSIICLIVLHISRNGIQLKTGIAGILCSICLFITHYRTAGIAAACVLAFTAGVIKDRGKQISMVILSTVLIVVAAVCLIPGGVVFDARYLLQFVLGFGGRFFYVEAASFGIALIGLVVSWKKRSEPFCFFILYSFVLTSVISSFFFMDGQRLDQLIYGRYIEMFMPVLIALGLKEILVSRDNLGMSAILTAGVYAALLTLYVDKVGYNEYLPNFVSGIDWMFGSELPDTMSVYFRPFIISFVGYLIIILAVKRKFLTALSLGMIFMVFIGVTFFLTEKHIYVYQDTDRADRLLEQKIEELQNEGRDWYFLDSAYLNYINLIQFWIYKKPVKLITEDVYDGMDHPVVLTYTTYDRPDKLTGYDNKEKSSHFILYYNDDP